MSPTSSWFTEGHMRQAIKVGNVINLSHPKPSKVEDPRSLREHDCQKYETARDPSYAAVQLSCHEVGGSRRCSMMRIVMQASYLGTEDKDKDSATRATPSDEIQDSGIPRISDFQKTNAT